MKTHRHSAEVTQVTCRMCGFEAGVADEVAKKISVHLRDEHPEAWAEIQAVIDKHRVGTGSAN